MVNDAEHLKALPMEKMADFLKWVVRFRVNKENYVDKEWQELAVKFKLKSVDELFGAMRFATTLFVMGACLRRADLESDLKSLGFQQGVLNRILDTFEDIWRESGDYLVRVRDGVIPTLSSLRWSVNVRRASSEYLRESEIVAVLRIGTSDKEKTNQMYVELDEDALSWLEIVIGKVKQEMLKAKEAPSV
jgi:hypothetical protein